MDPTTDELAEITEFLHLDVETGKLYWRKVKQRRPQLLGQEAGYQQGTLGYRLVKLNGKNYCSHRLVWFLFTGKWPEQEIDHINHITDDNRPENLRLVTKTQNQQNRRKRCDSAQEYKGVMRRHRKYQAMIQHNGQNEYLGLFDTAEEAAAAYDRRAIEMFGDFALLNSLQLVAG